MPSASACLSHPDFLLTRPCVQTQLGRCYERCSCLSFGQINRMSRLSLGSGSGGTVMPKQTAVRHHPWIRKWYWCNNNVETKQLTQSLTQSLTYGKDQCWRSLWRTVSHGRDRILEQGKSVRSAPPEEESTAETTCDELTTTPVTHPLMPLWGRRQRKLGVKLSPERRERWGEDVYKIWFYFSLSYSDLIGNKLN